MTKAEERREYMRRWREKNRDHIREYTKNKARADALAAMKSVKRLESSVCVIRTYDGGEYFVGGPKQ